MRLLLSIFLIGVVGCSQTPPAPGVTYSAAALTKEPDGKVKQQGEPISVARELTVELKEWSGETKLNWSIRADALLTARKPPKAADRRETAAKSWAAPDQGSKPIHPSTLDDAIPFACSWR